jgi:hypothetical protein
MMRVRTILLLYGTLNPIAISIFAAGFVSASNLAYAYLKILSPTKGQKIPAGSIVNMTAHPRQPTLLANVWFLLL